MNWLAVASIVVSAATICVSAWNIRTIADLKRRRDRLTHPVD